MKQLFPDNDHEYVYRPTRRNTLTGVNGSLSQIVTEAKSSKVTTQAEAEITSTLWSWRLISS